MINDPKNLTEQLQNLAERVAIEMRALNRTKVSKVNGQVPNSSGEVTISSVDNATKATSDASGNVISATYATKNELSNKANSSEVVKLTGNQTIAGTKTFSSTISGSVSGNAGTATKLASAKTITLDGDATGSISFDGSENKTLTVAVKDDSHNHVIGNVDGLQDALDEKANKESGVYFIDGTGTDAGVWLGTSDDIPEYYQGLTIAYKTSIAGVSGGSTLNINGLGAVAVVRNNGSAVTTQYGVGSILMLTYDIGADSGTPYWKMADYDSDTKTRSSNKADTKMYIIGAQSQSTSGQTTYSNSKCYIGTDNCLYSNGTKVSTSDTNTTYSLSNSGSTITLTGSDGSTDSVTLEVGSDYTLPTATDSVLGGVKVGSNITNTSGTISLTSSNVTSALGYTPLKTAPVTKVNGQTGDVTVDVGVTSFNGSKGAVTYTAPVTSVNGKTGAVTIDTGVTSFNGKSGAVTYSAPVSSVNGQTGAVSIDVGVKTVNGTAPDSSGNVTIEVSGGGGGSGDAIPKTGNRGVLAGYNDCVLYGDASQALEVLINQDSPDDMFISAFDESGENPTECTITFSNDGATGAFVKNIFLMGVPDFVTVNFDGEVYPDTFFVDFVESLDLGMFTQIVFANYTNGSDVNLGFVSSKNIYPM